MAKDQSFLREIIVIQSTPMTRGVWKAACHLCEEIQAEHGVQLDAVCVAAMIDYDTGLLVEARAALE